MVRGRGGGMGEAYAGRHRRQSHTTRSSWQQQCVMGEESTTAACPSGVCYCCVGCMCWRLDPLVFGCPANNAVAAPCSNNVCVGGGALVQLPVQAAGLNRCCLRVRVC